jgi:hypothetical protein
MGADRTRHSPIDQRNPPPLRTCGRNLGTTPLPRKKEPRQDSRPTGVLHLGTETNHHPGPSADAAAPVSQGNGAMPGDHPVPAHRLHGLRQVTVIPASILREFTRHAAPKEKPRQDSRPAGAKHVRIKFALPGPVLRPSGGGAARARRGIHRPPALPWSGRVRGPRLPGFPGGRACCCRRG